MTYRWTGGGQVINERGHAGAEEVGQGHRGHSLSITWAYGLYRDASSPPCPCVLVNLIGQPLLGRHLVEE